MPNQTVACPRCGTPIPVPAVLGDFLVCPGCHTRHKARAVPPPAAAVPAQTGRTIAIVVVAAGLGCMMLVGTLAVIGWLPVDTKKPVEKVNLPLTPAKPKATKAIDPKIAAAIDKGKAYLMEKALTLQPREVGRYAERYHAVFALMGLALLETDVPADDPAIKRVAQIVRGNARQRHLNYDLASCLFFLNRWDESQPLSAEDKKVAQRFALQLIDNQHPRGVWEYGGTPLSDEQQAALLAGLNEGRHMPGGVIVKNYSMSNSQFAMLALWAARRHGIQVHEALLSLANHCQNNQFEDGHWSYNGPNHYYETMCSTCCGLMALAMEKALYEDSEFKDKKFRTDPTRARTEKADLKKGFEYVARTIGRKMDDEGGARSDKERGALFGADAWGDLYFLWTLERLAVIYDKDKIDGKDWYGWGSKVVVDAQKDNGSWNDKHGPLVDTVFALLFLKRANIAKDLTIKLQSLQTMLQPMCPRRPRGKHV